MPLNLTFAALAPSAISACDSDATTHSGSDSHMMSAQNGTFATPPPPEDMDTSFIVSQTFKDIEITNVNAAIFGGLVCWTLFLFIKGCIVFYGRRKLIYLLNVGQISFMLIKTISAAIFAIFSAASVNCHWRSPLVNIPMIFAWDLIYIIMLIKLLLFTTWKKTCKMVISVALMAHFAIVVSGVALRVTTVNTTGFCMDSYPILFKQQYLIELSVEAFTTGMLLWAIMSKKIGVFERTREVFQQLIHNEHLRVFMVVAFITLKIIFTYWGKTSIVAFTHAIDTARSAVVSWALMRSSKVSNLQRPDRRGASSSGNYNSSGNTSTSRSILNHKDGMDSQLPTRIKVVRSSGLDPSDCELASQDMLDYTISSSSLAESRRSDFS